MVENVSIVWNVTCESLFSFHDLSRTNSKNHCDFFCWRVWLCNAMFLVFNNLYQLCLFIFFKSLSNQFIQKMSLVFLATNCQIDCSGHRMASIDVSFVCTTPQERFFECSPWLWKYFVVKGFEDYGAAMFQGTSANWCVIDEFSYVLVNFSKTFWNIIYKLTAYFRCFWTVCLEGFIGNNLNTMFTFINTASLNFIWIAKLVFVV